MQRKIFPFLLLKNISALLIFSLCISLLSSCASAESVQWLYSFEQALAQAKNENKLMMIDFYTDWCGWCKKLDNETYQNREVIELSRSFICLKIDADQNEELAQRYRVSGYPTILFTNAEGEIIGGGPGFRGAAEFLSEMQAVLAEFSQVRR